MKPEWQLIVKDLENNSVLMDSQFDQLRYEMVRSDHPIKTLDGKAVDDRFTLKLSLRAEVIKLEPASDKSV
jgi:hypothetical protein